MKTIKIISNVHDAETDLVHVEGKELSIAKDKADRWIDAGLAVEVKTAPIKNAPENKAEKKFD